jgi:hypothetical protein
MKVHTVQGAAGVNLHVREYGNPSACGSSGTLG